MSFKELKYKRIVFLTIVILFIYACNSETNTGKETTLKPNSVTYDTTLNTGSVIDSIACRVNNSNNYALYLPSYYTTKKKYPCVYFFDPHANGALPLRKYKMLAEKYGFIFIGSNICKNGMQWQNTDEIVRTLMEDCQNKISIDSNLIYTSGFSGGARVAGSVALFNGGIEGIIGCAAGFPDEAGKRIEYKFNYFGICGALDFNLTDLEMLDASLEQTGFNHQLIHNEGKHAWASPRDFETGLLWLQVNAMKEHKTLKKDTIIIKLKNDYIKRITDAKKNSDIIQEHDLLLGMIKVLDSLTDVIDYKKAYRNIDKDTDYKKTVKRNTYRQQTELKEQQELTKQMSINDENWWALKINYLKGNQVKATLKEDKQYNQRLLNYLGLIAYLNSNHSLNIGDLTNVIKYLKVFKLADPDNSDCSYLKAIYYAKSNNTVDAIAALNEAAKLGYSDIAQVVNIQEFLYLQNNEAFKNILIKIKENRLN